jgi:hypothetical protein
MTALASIFDKDHVPAYILPDPLIRSDGEPVLDAHAWRARRRPEILSLFETQVYGKTPSAHLERWTWVMHYYQQALAGQATRKEVRISLDSQYATLQTDLLIYLPSTSSGPVPLFLGLNFWGNHSIDPDPGITLSSQWMPDDAQRGILDHRATVASRGLSARRWPLGKILQRGYGLATLYYGDLDPDYDDGFENGVHGLFGREQSQDRRLARTADRRGDAWGAIGAWAWGLSRALDYFAQDAQIDARRVAVVGHSRLGKAALWAGAQDERFAMVISNDSGCGGAALSRRQFGETVQLINARFPHWFCTNFRSYGKHVDRLPVDQHMLLALIAPRPLYIASADQDLWADPRGEFLAAKGADPVYRLLGTDGLATETMPSVGQPIRSTIGYHLRSGQHDITEYDWLHFLDFADRYL